MRILLTGACGLLGSAIRRVGSGHTFVCLDVSDAVTALGGVRASITDRDVVQDAARGCDAIIHTAAMHGHWFGKATNYQFIETNVLGAEVLYEAALKFDIRRLAMSSTIEVLCGRTWDACGRGIVFDEAMPPRPDWIYPVTKLQVEQLGRFYAEHHGLEVIQLRYMTLDHPAKAFRLLARGVDVDDAARANLLAVTKSGLCSDVLHIGPDTPLRQSDVNQMLADDPWPVLERYWPGCRPVLEQHGHAPDPNILWPVTRIDRAKAVLGWQPQVTFTTFLAGLGWTPPANPQGT